MAEVILKDDILVRKIFEYLSVRRKSKQSIDKYMQMATNFTRFLEYFGKQPTPETAAEFLQLKLEKGVDMRSLKAYYFRLKMILAVHMNKSSKEIIIPFKIDRVKFKEPRYFDWQTINYILESAGRSPRDRIFLTAIVATMARREEILSLRKDDLTTERMVIEESDGTTKEVTGYFLHIRESKSQPRKIIIDKKTWEDLKELEPEKLGKRVDSDRIFPFSLAMANYILDRYKPEGTKGGLHAIRHGISRHIAGLLRTKADDDIREYYMGHYNPELVRNLYALIAPQRLWKWYHNYHPLMKKGITGG